MRSVHIFFDNRTFLIHYDIETFALGTRKDSQIINTFSVFIKEPTLIDIVGEHFTMIHDITYPGDDILFNINDPGSDYEKMLKQIIVKAIHKDFYNYPNLTIG